VVAQARAVAHREGPGSAGPPEKTGASAVRWEVDGSWLDWVDWRRALVQTGYAALIFAPAAHYWYEAIDRAVRLVCRRPFSPIEPYVSHYVSRCFYFVQ
jgi:hypothetical protein